MAASGMRDVDFALLAGETQRIPSLALPAVFAAPSVADDLARDVVTELFRDLAELFDRADIGFLVELTQRRRPRVLAAIDAALRLLPGVSVIDMLGPVEAAADEDTAFAVEDRHGDAGAVRQRLERRHLFRSGAFHMRARRALPAGIAGVAARIESVAVRECNGAAAGPPRVRCQIFAALVRHGGLRVRRVSRFLLDAGNEIERGVERLVVLRIRRDIGLRAGLFVAFGLEVAA